MAGALQVRNTTILPVLCSYLFLFRCYELVSNAKRYVNVQFLTQFLDIKPRGADFPDTHVINLEENYRSTGSIVTTSLAIVSQGWSSTLSLAPRQRFTGTLLPQRQTTTPKVTFHITRSRSETPPQRIHQCNRGSRIYCSRNKEGRGNFWRNGYIRRLCCSP